MKEFWAGRSNDLWDFEISAGVIRIRNRLDGRSDLLDSVCIFAQLVFKFTSLSAEGPIKR